MPATFILLIEECMAGRIMLPIGADDFTAIW